MSSNDLISVLISGNQGLRCDFHPSSSSSLGRGFSVLTGSSTFCSVIGSRGSRGSRSKGSSRGSNSSLCCGCCPSELAGWRSVQLGSLVSPVPAKRWGLGLNLWKLWSTERLVLHWPPVSAPARIVAVVTRLINAPWLLLYWEVVTRTVWPAGPGEEE